ncbi:Hypothetical protein AA314_07646 [Archangium gephyra]|uniref:Uncharacterized protein n=1 Tax=Archangium gephyra TaxID=48 RepID=A0AAC8QF60_9BACT|nr:Hypothetical protein AA314_07646 [Archangium gephyra]
MGCLQLRFQVRGDPRRIQRRRRGGRRRERWEDGEQRHGAAHPSEDGIHVPPECGVGLGPPWTQPSSERPPEAARPGSIQAPRP